MTRTSLKVATAAGVLSAIVAIAAGCTMKSQEAPALTGPSELGTSISITVTPDILSQDGASQSLVTVTARDSNGNPLKNLSLRSEIQVGGVTADFGTLSARNIVTGADGRATLVYTAPPAPAGPAVDTNTTVNIAITPVGSDFGNSFTRTVTIRLKPIGVVVPGDGLAPYFTVTPPSPTDHQTVLFEACNDPQRPCATPGNPIASYSWDFGDGRTGSDRTASHSYDVPGTYVVTLRVVDAIGRSGTTSQTLNVGGGTAPTASFLVSPSTARIGQVVNFNAAATVPAPGRTIRSYAWDFGDGESKTTTTAQTTHDYQATGTYTVTLLVTDDAGRTSVATQTVTISGDAPTADFSFSPTSPTAGTAVRFSAAGSSAIEGRTITGYLWDFGDGTPTSTAATPTHSFAAPGTYNVTLTVTDSAGKTGRVTKSVTVL